MTASKMRLVHAMVDALVAVQAVAQERVPEHQNQADAQAAVRHAREVAQRDVPQPAREHVPRRVAVAVVVVAAVAALLLAAAGVTRGVLRRVVEVAVVNVVVIVALAAVDIVLVNVAPAVQRDVNKIALVHVSMAVIRFVAVLVTTRVAVLARMCRRDRIALPGHVPPHAEIIAIELVRWLVARVACRVV